MNRSTHILGFALLAVAATLAASITLRNAPGRPTRAAPRPVLATPAPAASRSADLAPADPPAPNRNVPRRQGQAHAEAFRVTLPADLLEAMPPAQRDAWRARAAAVENRARQSLERLTAELDLSAAQRAKMFPALVRSAPGYDPRMQAGSGTPAAPTALTAAEEVRQALDPEQRTTLENRELDRQLWWQDILERLEADLIGSTGGTPDPPAATVPPPPADDPPAAQDRVAPPPRDDGNLFDLLQGNP